jgi:hypothetical protein
MRHPDRYTGPPDGPEPDPYEAWLDHVADEVATRDQDPGPVDYPAEAARPTRPTQPSREWTAYREVVAVIEQIGPIDIITIDMISHPQGPLVHVFGIESFRRCRDAGDAFVVVEETGCLSSYDGRTYYRYTTQVGGVTFLHLSTAPPAPPALGGM